MCTIVRVKIIININLGVARSKKKIIKHSKRKEESFRSSYHNITTYMKQRCIEKHVRNISFCTHEKRIYIHPSSMSFIQIFPWK